MNIALQRSDGIFIIPMLQVVWIIFSVLGGGIYFRGKLLTTELYNNLL